MLKPISKSKSLHKSKSVRRSKSLRKSKSLHKSKSVRRSKSAPKPKPKSKFKPRSPEQYTSADYLNLLRKKWKYNNQSKQIAIIGAGMSGLICGWLLRLAGNDVRIFEASNIVGGRVKTLRDGFSSNLYAEAGAMRIPENRHLTEHLVKKFKLPTWKFKNSCENTRIFLNNTGSTREKYEKTTQAFGFSLDEHEKQKTTQAMLEESIEGLLRRKEVVGRRFKLAKLGDIFSSRSRMSRIRKIRKALDEYSLGAFLAEEVDEGRLSAGAVDLITLLEGLETHLSASLTAILDDHLILNNTKIFHQIQNGMDRLPKALLKKSKLTEKIRYNSRVFELEQALRDDGGDKKTNKVFVHIENTITGHVNNAKNTDRERGDKGWFDLVVIAIPFSALRRMRMPGLGASAEKRRAIRQLHYDNACKILLEFGKPFWGEEKITGGSSVTDLPIRRICYPIQQQSRSKRCILLASYTWGDDSLRWTSLKQKDRIRFALRDVMRVHDIDDNEQNQFRKSCIGGMSHSWAEDEFTSGAFALFEPYQLSKLFNDVWKPEGLLHYCGEHTSLKHGWIEGAVESGIRVADEICGRIDQDPTLTMPIDNRQR